jgi:RNA polymerase sigma factor (sigma-70 family)
MRNPQQLFDSSIYKKAYGLVRSYVTKRSGSFKDFEDIFQEGVYIFLRKIQSKNLKLTCEPEIYILGVCKKLWLRELGNRQIHLSTDILENIEDNRSDGVTAKERMEFLITLLERNIKKLSQKCQDIFNYRKEGLSCEEIAERMNLDSGQISRNKLYTCKRRLLSLVYRDVEYEAFLKDEEEY